MGSSQSKSETTFHEWNWNGSLYDGLTKTATVKFSGSKFNPSIEHDKCSKGPLDGIHFNKLVKTQHGNFPKNNIKCFKPSDEMNLTHKGDIEWYEKKFTYKIKRKHPKCIKYKQNTDPNAPLQCLETSKYKSKTGFKTYIELKNADNKFTKFFNKEKKSLGNGTEHRYWQGMSQHTYKFGVRALNQLNRNKDFRTKYCPYLLFPKKSCYGNIRCRASCYKSSQKPDADTLYSLKTKAIQNLAKEGEALTRTVTFPFQGHLKGVKEIIPSSIMSQRVTEADVTAEDSSGNPSLYTTMIGNQTIAGPWLPNKNVNKTRKAISGLRCVNKSSNANKYQKIKYKQTCTNNKCTFGILSSKDARYPLLFDTSFHPVKCTLDFNSEYVRNRIGASNVNATGFQGYKVFYNTKTKNVIPYFMAATDSTQSKKLFRKDSGATLVEPNWVLLQRVKNKDHLLEDDKFMLPCNKLGNGTSGFQTYACPLFNFNDSKNYKNYETCLLNNVYCPLWKVHCNKKKQIKNASESVKNKCRQENLTTPEKTSLAILCQEKNYKNMIQSHVSMCKTLKNNKVISN